MSFTVDLCKVVHQGKIKPCLHDAEFRNWELQLGKEILESQLVVQNHLLRVQRHPKKKTTPCVFSGRALSTRCRVLYCHCRNVWCTYVRLGVPMPGQCSVQFKIVESQNRQVKVEKFQRRAYKMTEGMEQLLMRRDCRGWIFSHKAKGEGILGVC